MSFSPYISPILSGWWAPWGGAWSHKTELRLWSRQKGSAIWLRTRQTRATTIRLRFGQARWAIWVWTGQEGSPIWIWARQEKLRVRTGEKGGTSTVWVWSREKRHLWSWLGEMNGANMHILHILHVYAYVRVYHHTEAAGYLISVLLIFKLWQLWRKSPALSVEI